MNLQSKRLTVSISTVDIPDGPHAWDRNEQIATELAGIFRKITDLLAHNAALPEAPIMGQHGQIIGSIEWEDI